MKKLTVILLLPLLLSFLHAAPKDSTSKKAKPKEMVEIKIENPSFSGGRAYLSKQFATPHYIGRVGPGQTTTLKVPAPINDNYWTLYVTVNGRVVHSAALSGNIEPGDKIEWDLFSNMITWTFTKKEGAK